MLIGSDRHRQEDLDLWEELYSADRVSKTHGRLVARSLAAIRSFYAAGAAYVGVSWGKDSVCVAHLVRQVDPNIPLINLRCSNRNPDCDSVRDAYLDRFPSDYCEVGVDYHGLHAQLLPSHILNAATDSIWFAAIRESGKPFNGRHITGIRAGESTGRMVRSCRWGENSPRGCAPLAWWSLQDVFGYLAANDLPIHAAYAMLGGGRWSRDKIRVAEIGDTHGTGGGRAEWEREYYEDLANRLIVAP